MKRNILSIITLMVVVAGLATGFTTKNGVDLSHYKIASDAPMCYNVPTEDEFNLLKPMPNVSYKLFLGKTYVGFKEALGFKESQGRYDIVNQFGYLGKYQFSKNTLKMIGIANAEQFLQDTRLQEDAFTANAARNKWILRRDIKRYVGRNIGGVHITESGILAAAHLAGAGNVKKYLRSGGALAFSDAFGTSIRHYLKKFSGYDTSKIKADRRARVI